MNAAKLFAGRFAFFTHLDDAVLLPPALTRALELAERRALAERALAVLRAAEGALQRALPAGRVLEPAVVRDLALLVEVFLAERDLGVADLPLLLGLNNIHTRNYNHTRRCMVRYIHCTNTNIKQLCISYIQFISTTHSHIHPSLNTYWPRKA